MMAFDAFGHAVGPRFLSRALRGDPLVRFRQRTEHVADACIKVSHAAKYRTGLRESPGVDRQRAARGSMPAIALAAICSACRASAIVERIGRAWCRRYRNAAAMRNATVVSDTEAINQSSGKRVRRLIVQRAS
ncbi:hypothetical protein [Burkholderia ubonensis]|uniref:hypothetical protein n=2 Tax=Burkholderia ubonensis TaxID=101571 RepID=UPI0012F7E69D|nr:hypothetical protein [Burkholderia ubonensis]